MSYRVLVCGGRDFSNRALVASTLDTVHAERRITVLIEGGARGADAFARAWSDASGVMALTFEANWSADGKAAGPIRNQRMLDVGKPDLVVAFPGGRGTADMLRRARRAGVQVVEVLPDGDPDWDSCARPTFPKETS